MSLPFFVFCVCGAIVQAKERQAAVEADEGRKFHLKLATANSRLAKNVQADESGTSKPFHERM